MNQIHLVNPIVFLGPKAECWRCPAGSSAVLSSITHDLNIFVFLLIQVVKPNVIVCIYC